MLDNNFFYIFAILGLSINLLSSIIYNGSIYFQLLLIFVIIILSYYLRIEKLKENEIQKFLDKVIEYFQLEDWDNSLLFVEKILNLDSNNPIALYYKSYIFYYKKKYMGSLDLINLLDCYEVFDFLLLKGRILIAQKEYENGLNCYAESLNFSDFDLFKYIDEITYYGDPLLFRNNKKNV